MFDAGAPMAGPVAGLQFEQQARKIVPRPVNKTRIGHKLKVVAVAPARPDQNGFVLEQELGNGQAKRLANAARIQARIATRNKVSDPLPVRGGREVDDPLMCREAFRVQQEEPEVFTALQRRFDCGRYEGGTLNWLTAPCLPTTNASEGRPNSARRLARGAGRSTMCGTNG